MKGGKGDKKTVFAGMQMSQYSAFVWLVKCSQRKD